MYYSTKIAYFFNKKHLSQDDEKKLNSYLINRRNIINNAKVSLKNIKYVYYNGYSNDKQELVINNAYWVVARFEQDKPTEETKDLIKNMRDELTGFSKGE